MAAILGGAASLGIVTRAPACGPWLPEQILVSHRVILRTPVGDYAQEVLALTEEDSAPALPPGLTRVPAAALHAGYDGSGDEPSAPSPPNPDLAELREALEHDGVPPEKREAIASAYQAFCAELTEKMAAMRPTSDGFRFDEHARTIRAEAAPPSGGPFVLPAALAEALPSEWSDYQEGAYYFWHKDLPAAHAAWERLLARPLAQRRYRSTWAAYMLARIDDQPDAAPEDREHRYQRVRQLRAEGCRDVFNLASDSFGWEGRVALDHRDFPAAMRLYYLQGVSGAGLSDPMASSLRTVVEEIVKDGPASETMTTAGHDPFLRRVVTLYLACHRRFASELEVPDEQSSDKAAANKAAELEQGWINILTRENVNAVCEATPIAWSAYQQGDYAQAAAWLAKAPAADGLALWLRAKLALRDGQTDAAAKFFARAVRSFPVEIKATDDGLDEATELAQDAATFRASQFHADLGIISLSRGDYAQALSALLRSTFWRDAAYVAERVMTTDELRAYVRKNFAAAPPPAPDPAASSTPDPGDAPAAAPTTVEAIQASIARERSANPAVYALRYLLARRLARDGRYAEARPYYPAPLWPKFDEYVAALKLGQNDRQPKDKRADALWRAAKIGRWLGMELFGAEDDPDWMIDDGQLEEEPYRERRVGAPPSRKASAEADNPNPTPPPVYVPPLSADEKRRVGRHAIHPEERYHYRYLAADLAWKAAALMADQQEGTAQVLAAGGLWLESVGETKAADRFYIAILRRCNRTATGQKADKTGAIPRDVHDDL